MTWLLVVVLCAGSECTPYAVKTFQTEAQCLTAAKHNHRPSAAYSNPHNFCIVFGDQS